MKRIDLNSGDFVEIESLGKNHGVRVFLRDKMGYVKKCEYFTDEQILKMFKIVTEDAKT